MRYVGRHIKNYVETTARTLELNFLIFTKILEIYANIQTWQAYQAQDQIVNKYHHTITSARPSISWTLFVHQTIIYLAMLYVI